MVGCIVTTEGVCLLDEEKSKIGCSGVDRAATNAGSGADTALWLSMYRSRMPAFTLIPGHLGDVGSYVLTPGARGKPGRRGKCYRCKTRMF
jgi:hypothetical protein